MTVYLVMSDDLSVHSIHESREVARSLAEELNDTQKDRIFSIHPWYVNQSTETRRLWLAIQHQDSQGLQVARIRTWLVAPEWSILAKLTYQSLLNAPAKMKNVWYVVVEEPNWQGAYHAARALLSQHIDQRP